MKVAVVGAAGQLGSDVSREFCRNGDEVRDLSHGEIEICSLTSVRAVLQEAKPETIVNTAAMHHVEECEGDPLKAYDVNGLGSRNLATVAHELGAVLIHISTDYVFDGSKKSPYVETDAALPLNVYGNTKLAGESFVRTMAEKHFILRTSALYGTNPCRGKGGRNFVERMLRLAGERQELRVVDDETVSPTPTAELARQIVILSRSGQFGLYHATSEGSCTWYEFAAKIFDLAGVRTKLTAASPGEFPAKVARPRYSVLENRALKALGLNGFHPWEEGLRSYLSELIITH